MALLNIAKTYARQIMRGNKIFNNVPESIKEQVKEELIKMGAPKEMYGEEDAPQIEIPVENYFG